MRYEKTSDDMASELPHKGYLRRCGSTWATCVDKMATAEVTGLLRAEADRDPRTPRDLREDELSTTWTRGRRRR